MMTRRHAITAGAATISMPASVLADGTSEKCPREGKWFGGCQFEPRYDLGPTTFEAGSYIGFKLQETLEAYRPKTYVCDVCVTCGKVLKRPA